VEDKEGYKTAAKVLETEFNKLTDSIKIKDPEIALTEVQAWETQ
jgi:hypothetical protein